jgi:hypothetical protein
MGGESGSARRNLSLTMCHTIQSDDGTASTNVIDRNPLVATTLSLSHLAMQLQAIQESQKL